MSENYISPKAKLAANGVAFTLVASLFAVIVSDLRQPSAMSQSSLPEIKLDYQLKTKGYKGGPIHSLLLSGSAEQETGIIYRDGEKGRYGFDPKNKTHIYAVINNAQNYYSAFIIDEKGKFYTVSGSVALADIDRAKANENSLKASFLKGCMPNVSSFRSIARPALRQP